MRSSLTVPGGARTVGVLVALAGVALLVVGIVAIGGGGDSPSGAAPAPTVASAPSSPSSAASTPSEGSAPAPGTGAPTPTAAPSTSVPPPGPGPTTSTATPRAPLTVLNNSTIRGLADRAATEAERRGWPVAQVGNFAGRLVATTVYYTPGDAAQEAAARQLAAEFPHVEQVLPRYAGLPPTPPGIVLVVTKDW